MKDKPWKNEELRRWEESMLREKECDLEKGIKNVQSKDRNRM